MAKTGLLSPLRVGRESKPGRFGDGGGLYLQVKPGGSKSWLFMYKQDKKTLALGLGSFPDLSLASARKKAEAIRAMRENGVDPRAHRDAERQRQLVEVARAMTFKQCAEAYITAQEASWKNDKHRQQWRNTLATYVYPVIGKLPVAAVDAPLVLKVLHQTVPPATGKVGGLLWHARPDTANRVRGRIELILDWAGVNNYRDRDKQNPARWKGNLAHALPKRSKTQALKHHAALPFAEIAGFARALRERDGVATMALEFLILTAGRTGEVIGARWDEIDEGAALWTIPAERMKGGREHRVPLSDAALAVLTRVKPLCRGDYVFPAASAKKPLSNMALLAVLHRMGRDDITAHGFRSTFRDWTAECTGFPGEVAEMALAHAVEDKVEAAYRRGDLFEKRRALMKAWAGYCERTGDNVVTLAKAVA
jgi:integrase